ncbi:hypothetical protein [Oscillatoria acuminata]|nr:hypothetical protein [Oscillatoria acuminata]
MSGQFSRIGQLAMVSTAFASTAIAIAVDCSQSAKGDRPLNHP